MYSHLYGGTHHLHVRSWVVLDSATQDSRDVGSSPPPPGIQVQMSTDTVYLYLMRILARVVKTLVASEKVPAMD